MEHLIQTLGQEVYLLNSILARTYNTYDGERGLHGLEIILIIALVALGIFAATRPKPKQPKKCGMCNNMVPHSSDTKEEMDGYVFCSLQCRLKYQHTIADLINKTESAGKVKIIIKDQNKKYL
jgi:hypothetical protein